MRFLISAVLQSLALLIAAGIVFLFANKVLDFDSDRTFGEEKVTIAVAAGMAQKGEKADNESLVEFSKMLFGKNTTKTISLSQPMLDFINEHTVNRFFAKFIRFYIPIGFVAGFICLVCGIGVPFRWKRGTSLFDVCDQAVGADPSVSVIHRMSDGREYEGYAGDTKSCLFMFFMLFVYFILVTVWGLLLVPIVVIDLFISILIGLFSLIKFCINKAASAKA